MGRESTILSLVGKRANEMRFSEAGNDMYICQVCGKDLDSVVHPPSWRPDLVGCKRACNVCPSCVTRMDAPVGLYEHCKQESGLSNPEAVRQYMNRHYGHG